MFNMAEIVNNKQGFRIIKMNYEDLRTVGFGHICDNCGNLLTKPNEIYYVAVLNRAFCKNCYKHWICNAYRYTEDIPYEERNFEFYAKQLDLL